MKLLFLIFISLFIFGCTFSKEETVQKPENLYEVKLLFKKDNCSVYTFHDRGSYHYFTNCTETISTPCGQVGKTRQCNNENIGVKKQI